MTYDELITDICSQLGDPNKDTYESRAKDHLQAAISQLIKDKNYKLEELPGFVKQQAINFNPNPCDISSYNPIEIIDVLPKYDITYATTPYFMKFKKLNQLGGIHGNVEEQPTKEDVLIIHYGNNLEAIINQTASDFVLATDVYMFYIEDPDILTGWVGGNTITDDFRMSFIQRAKLIAIQNLKVEDEISN